MNSNSLCRSPVPAVIIQGLSREDTQTTQEPPITEPRRLSRHQRDHLLLNALLVLLRLHSNPLARQRPLLLRGNLRLNGLPPVRLQPNAAGSKP